jgi:hypothetical protein
LIEYQVLPLVAPFLLERERLLLERLREQGTVAQPLVVLQQEELAAAVRMFLQSHLQGLDLFGEP